VLAAAPEDVVQRALAQRVVADLHALDLELGEGGVEDEQAAGDHRPAVGRQPGSLMSAIWSKSSRRSRMVSIAGFGDRAAR
jgi:hypothetical protein